MENLKRIVQDSIALKTKVLNSPAMLELTLKVADEIVKCFKDFRAVKEACFGKNLEKGFHRSFEQLKNSFFSVQEMAEGLGGKLSITWKIHILLCHVLPFVEYNNCGLSKYAEQCGEAIHSKFKPTHSRYKRMEEHPEHGERLLSSVLSFNGRRIC